MKHRLVDKFISNRASFVEILIAAVFLAISASGIASILFEYFKDSSFYLLMFFCVILLASIVILAKKTVSMRKQKLRVEGYIITDPQENVLINVPRYRYSEDLAIFMAAAFKENPALLIQWNKEPLGSAFELNSEDGLLNKKSTAAARLIKEATEYYVLDNLSAHLADYFDKSKCSGLKLREYSRKDVPDILLSNRFMELFTAPIENRTSFSNESYNNNEGEAIMLQGKGGEIYHRFNLTLPSGTIVSRDNSGAIKFDTEYFILIFEVQFEEFSYVSPRGFEEYYLGIADFEKSREYKIDIEFYVEFKISSFLKSNKWNYHAWIDGFLCSLEKDMSASSFFDHIQWDLAHTIIQCGGMSVYSNRLDDPGN
ncbi:hypothetical protein [Vreelandella sp. GE22]